MRVAADEELWWRGIDTSGYAAVVVAWIAADMFHQHIHVFAFKPEHFGKHKTQVAAVAVAADGT